VASAKALKLKRIFKSSETSTETDDDPVISNKSNEMQTESKFPEMKGRECSKCAVYTPAGSNPGKM